MDGIVLAIAFVLLSSFPSTDKVNLIGINCASLCFGDDVEHT